MEPRVVRFEEIVKTKCPPGTHSLINEVARATGRKPAQVIREAVLAAVRHGAPLKGETK